MASEGKWETVPMKNKPNRVENPKSKKNQTKAFIDNMPRVEAQPPVKPSKTVYDAFIDKNKDLIDKPGSVNLNNNHVENKNKTKEKKEKPKTFEEASKKLEETDVQKLIDRAQTSVKSTNQEAWIKELTIVFNAHFKYLPQPDVFHKDKPKNYPSSALKRDSSNKLLSSIKQASSQTLEQIYFLVTQNMVNESNKGSIYGYQIILQLLARDNPKIILPRLNQYLEILNANKLKEKQSELVLWSLIQCASLNVKVGVKAIVADFLPAMRVKLAAPYSLQYMEQFFRQYGSSSEGFDEISLKDYFHTLDLLYNSKTTIEVDLRDRLNIILDNIKTLAYGSNPKSSLRHFFPHYISRLDTSSSEAQQQEYLSSLVTCLSVDKQCFPDWCQLYTKHLPQSGLLLQYINDNYKSVSRKFPRKVFHQTVRSFSLTNEEMNNGKPKNRKEGLDRCIVACKELQLKINQSGFPWKFLFFLILTTLGCVVAYDIQTSKNWRVCKSMKLLEDYGILTVINKGWERLLMFANKTQAWLNVNAPVYRDSIVPYMTLAWNKVVEYYYLAVAFIKPYVMLAWSKLGEAVVWFNTQYPNFWPQCKEYMIVVQEFLYHHIVCTWHCIIRYSGQAYDWIIKNVLVGQFSPENIQRTVMWSLEMAQNYTRQGLNWCFKQAHSIMS